MIIVISGGGVPKCSVEKPKGPPHFTTFRVPNPTLSMFQFCSDPNTMYDSWVDSFYFILLNLSVGNTIRVSLFLMTPVTEHPLHFQNACVISDVITAFWCTQIQWVDAREIIMVYRRMQNAVASRANSFVKRTFMRYLRDSLCTTVSSRKTFIFYVRLFDSVTLLTLRLFGTKNLYPNYECKIE